MNRDDAFYEILLAAKTRNLLRLTRALFIVDIDITMARSSTPPNKTVWLTAAGWLAFEGDRDSADWLVTLGANLGRMFHGACYAATCGKLSEVLFKETYFTGEEKRNEIKDWMNDNNSSVARFQCMKYVLAYTYGLHSTLTYDDLSRHYYGIYTRREFGIGRMAFIEGCLASGNNRRIYTAHQLTLSSSEDCDDCATFIKHARNGDWESCKQWLFDNRHHPGYCIVVDFLLSYVISSSGFISNDMKAKIYNYYQTDPTFNHYLEMIEKKMACLCGVCNKIKLFIRNGNKQDVMKLLQTTSQHTLTCPHVRSALSCCGEFGRDDMVDDLLEFLPNDARRNECLQALINCSIKNGFIPMAIKYVNRNLILFLGASLVYALRVGVPTFHKACAETPFIQDALPDIPSEAISNLHYKGFRIRETYYLRAIHLFNDLRLLDTYDAPEKITQYYAALSRVNYGIVKKPLISSWAKLRQSDDEHIASDFYINDSDVHRVLTYAIGLSIWEKKRHSTEVAKLPPELWWEVTRFLFPHLSVNEIRQLVAWYLACLQGNNVYGFLKTDLVDSAFLDSIEPMSSVPPILGLLDDEK